MAIDLRNPKHARAMAALYGKQAEILLKLASALEAGDVAEVDRLYGKSLRVALAIGGAVASGDPDAREKMHALIDAIV